MKSILRGIGSYVPEKILDNKELSLKVETSDDWIRTRTGIRERRIASSEQPTSELALKRRAKKKAIEAAQIQPNQIDLSDCCDNHPRYGFSFHCLYSAT